MRSMTRVSRISRLALGLAALTLITTAVARAEFEEPPVETKKLGPSSRYSGASAIDLSNGLPGNNGTFGLPNPDFEVWAKTGHVVPGLSEKTYPFEKREQLVKGLNEQVLWGDEMIANYRRVTPEISKPEGKAHAEEAIKTMDPLLAHLRQATSKVTSAGQADWETAQSDARKALLDFRAAYTGMHHNIVRH